MYHQNGSHKPVNNHLDRRHERSITVGDCTVDLYYPGTTDKMSKEEWNNSKAEIRLVGQPPPGWEADLVASIEGLDRSTKIGDIYGYLPGGSYITYQLEQDKIPVELSYQSEPDRIPVEIGIAEEVIGQDLERVVKIIELWLKKKLDSGI